MKNTFILFLLLVTCFNTKAQTAATELTPFYIEITGQTQGKIEGSVTQRGRERLIEGKAFYQDIAQEVYNKAARPKLTFFKQVDKATPALINAVLSNEILTKVKFTFYKKDESGREVLYYTLELANAKLQKLTNSFGPNKDERTYREVDLKAFDGEIVELSFEKATWTYVDGGRTAVWTR